MFRNIVCCLPQPILFICTRCGLIVVVLLETLVLKHAVQGGALTIDPPESAVLPGANVNVMCKENVPLKLCSFKLPSWPSWENVGYTQPSADAGVSYLGAGLATGECGVTVRNVTDESNGLIECKVLTVEGSEFRKYMRLTIAQPPDRVILTVNGSTKGSINFKHGDLLEATCTVHGGRPVANITWYLGDDVIRQDGINQDPLSESRLPHEEQLITQHVNRTLGLDDSGKILKCLARHMALRKPKAIKRLLLADDTVTFDPPEVVVLPGADVTVTCSFTLPLKSCSFLLPDTPGWISLNNDGSDSHSLHQITKVGTNACAVHVGDVSYENNGIVRCQIQTLTGIKRRGAMSFIVAKPPGLIRLTVKDSTNNNTVIVKNGDLLEATCTVSGGRPVANLTWYLGDDVIRQDDINQDPLSDSRLPHEEQSITQNVTRTVRLGDDGKKLKCLEKHIALTSARFSTRIISVTEASLSLYIVIPGVVIAAMVLGTVGLIIYLRVYTRGCFNTIASATDPDYVEPENAYEVIRESVVLRAMAQMSAGTKVQESPDYDDAGDEERQPINTGPKYLSLLPDKICTNPT